MPATGIVLVLDQITDPHNVGAILRTAAAFAVAAIVTTARHSPEATGVLAKSASGALELVPIVTVQNLARGCRRSRSAAFCWSASTATPPDDLAAIELRAPLALVLGAEGKGLRQLTGETCDRLARLDLPGEIKSLNVSNAAALALYIANRAIACEKNKGPRQRGPLHFMILQRSMGGDSAAPGSDACRISHNRPPAVIRSG